MDRRRTRNWVCTTLSDVEESIPEIAKLTQDELCKSVFEHMLKGFRVLLESLECHYTRAFRVVKKWLHLYMKIQNEINPNDENVCEQFEKLVPPVVTYIIGCLQFEAGDITDYHIELLDMMYQILENAQAATMQKLITHHSDAIAALWYPLRYGPDFDVQVMALRLLGILECNLRDHITDDALFDKYMKAINVVNYPISMYKDNVREFLNAYNISLAPRIPVYSFHCESFQLGERFVFSKTLYDRYFWMDLNVRARTLSFIGRYRAANQREQVDVAVAMKICKIEFNNNLMAVKFEPPIRATKALGNIADMQTVNYAKIKLSRDEALRLQRNYLFLRGFQIKYREDEPTDVQLQATKNTSSNATLASSSGSQLKSNTSTETVVKNVIIPSTSSMSKPSILNVPKGAMPKYSQERRVPSNSYRVISRILRKYKLYNLNKICKGNAWRLKFDQYKKALKPYNSNSHKNQILQSNSNTTVKVKVSSMLIDMPAVESLESESRPSSELSVMESCVTMSSTKIPSPEYFPKMRVNGGFDCSWRQDSSSISSAESNIKNFVANALLRFDQKAPHRNPFIAKRSRETPISFNTANECNRNRRKRFRKRNMKPHHVKSYTSLRNKETSSSVSSSDDENTSSEKCGPTIWLKRRAAISQNADSQDSSEAKKKKLATSLDIYDNVDVSDDPPELSYRAFTERYLKPNGSTSALCLNTTKVTKATKVTKNLKSFKKLKGANTKRSRKKKRTSKLKKKSAIKRKPLRLHSNGKPLIVDLTKDLENNLTIIIE